MIFLQKFAAVNTKAGMITHFFLKNSELCNKAFQGQKFPPKNFLPTEKNKGTQAFLPVKKARRIGGRRFNLLNQHTDTDRNVCATLKQYAIEMVAESPGFTFYLHFWKFPFQG